VVHGRTFFDLREQLARALLSYPDYRRWVLGKLAADSAEDLQDLRERFRRRAPGASNEAIELALAQSEEGRRIRDRASNPSPLDLTRHLSAWLGDIPAIELFERWETERIHGLLAQHPAGADPGIFAKRWRALRDVLFAPSYARELTLLTPAHDPRLDRIGFFRVILPRPGWYQSRIRDEQNHPGWTDLPFDLVPERPMAYRAVDWLLIEHPDLADHLRTHGYRVAGLDYSSFAKPRKQTPRRAFRQTRVAVDLAAVPGRMRVEFDLERHDVDAVRTKLVGLRIAVDGDPVMETLASAAQDRAQLGVLADAAR
jgi:hypothetical protein